jgi:hypothetical protein
MTHSSERNITIDADYQPPSVNRWTPEDDLVQKLYAPHPIDEQHEANALWSDDLFLGVLLIVVMPVAVFVLLAY